MIIVRGIHVPFAAAAIVALSLHGCGGGGGGGSSAASTPPLVAQPEPEPAPPATSTYTITGIARTSSSQATDSDNNDPARPYLANDTPSTAQAIGNPITLGGYANQPGSGAPGRSLDSGDIDDFFRVELLAGQRVTMLVADYTEADADLYLYDLQGNVLDFSVETGEVESLLIPSDGTYFINVFAFAGGTNYILAVGANNLAAGASPLRAEIVPWQSVVTFHDMPHAEHDSSAQHDAIRRLGMMTRSAGRSRGRSRLMAMQRDARIEQRLGSAMAKLGAMQTAQLRARWETLLTIKQLRREPQIANAEPNYRVRALATPNDAAFPFQWHYPLIGLPQAWETSSGDPGVVIAVVDTGILAAHPDLAGQLVPGYDFVSDPLSAADGDGIDPDPQDSGSQLGGGSFHGTHVSGTVAAAGNNSVGVVGTAYSSRVMPLRALGNGGSGTSYDVGQALRFAGGLANDSGSVPERPADIINLSLGGAPFSASRQALYRELRAAGVMVVAAAGNEASTAPGYPASYQGVLSVSAVDAQRRLTSYSNSGAGIDLAAPGGDNSVDLNGDGYPDGVLSTGASRDANGLRFEYTFLSGTSMAAPHVAGVLALMKSVNPALIPEDIDALLAAGELSDDLGIPGRDDEFGYGLINANQAVQAALAATGGSPANNPRLVASASTLNFSSAVDSLELVLENGGGGDLALQTLQVSQPWLAINAIDSDAEGLGVYRIEVDRNALDAGTYGAYVTATSTRNSVSVRILMVVGDGDSSGDIGLAYILLYDTASGELAAQYVSTVDQGNYAFQFDDIPPGRYEIIAGSDADNDLVICDPGEACGAWLTLDQPIVLDVQDDVQDINFPIEYQVSLPALRGLSKTQANGKGVVAKKRLH